MRKIDEKKPSIGKAAKTINFDKIVLEKLESKALHIGTTVSNIVNMLCKQTILNDVEFYRELSKYHYLKFQEYRFMKEQVEVKIE